MSRHPKEEHLALAATGDLGWWRERSVRRHLAGCGECGSRLEDYRRLREEAGALPVVEPPENLPAMILARLGEAAAPRSGFAFRVAWAGAALVALAALVVVLAPGPKKDVAVSPPARVVDSPSPSASAPTPELPAGTARSSAAKPAVLLAATLQQAEAERDRRFLQSLAHRREAAALAKVLEQWTAAAESQARSVPRVVSGARAETLRSHALPGQVTLVNLPGAPLEIVAARAWFAEGRLIDPQVEVRNRSARPVGDVQAIWVFRDAAGAEFRGRTVARAANLASGQRLAVGESIVFETERQGGDAEIVAARVFLRAVGFSDQRQVWAPERAALESAGLGAFVPLSSESERLWAAYRQRGADALRAALVNPPR